MSYYNYLMKPVKVSQNIDHDYEFTEDDDGFGNLKDYLGEDFIHKNNHGKDSILLQTVPKSSFDVFRPNDLKTGFLNKDRKCFIGDADCCTPVEYIEDAVDWVNFNDLSLLEDVVEHYQDFQIKSEVPLLIYKF